MQAVLFYSPKILICWVYENNKLSGQNKYIINIDNKVIIFMFWFQWLHGWRWDNVWLTALPFLKDMAFRKGRAASIMYGQK